MPQPLNGIGFLISAGYLLPGMPLELAGSFAMVRASGDDSAITENNEAGGAISYYFAQHPFKLQADLFRIWQPEGFDFGETRLRVQLQAGL